MPGIVRLCKKELNELIEVTEAAEGDTTELKRLLAEVTEEEERLSETGKPPGMAAGGQRRGDDN